MQDVESHQTQSSRKRQELSRCLMYIGPSSHSAVANVCGMLLTYACSICIYSIWMHLLHCKMHVLKGVYTGCQPDLVHSAVEVSYSGECADR